MRLLRIDEVRTLTGLSRSSLYEAIKQGRFPPAVKIGLRAVAWKASDVEAWIAARPAAAVELRPAVRLR